MAILLGLVVALMYGSGDFFGGLAARRTSAGTVVVGSFALSALLLGAVSLAWAVVGHPPPLTAHDAAIGVAVGLVGPAVLALFYASLASGRMSVVAPTTAVVSAVVPFAWGLGQGERPAALALGGVAVAVAAVGLISAAPEHGSDPAGPTGPGLRRVVLAAAGSGLGFGVIFILLGSTTDDPGLWPLVVARPTAALVTVAALAGAARRRGRPVRDAVVARPAAWRVVVATGVLDIGANAVYLAATQRGLLSIVAVLSSLYPASTVVLARFVLHERLHRAQVVGLGLAAVGVVAMTAG